MESSLQAIKNKKGTLHFFFKPCNLLWVFQLSITCQHFSPAIYEIKQRNQWQHRACTWALAASKWWAEQTAFVTWPQNGLTRKPFGNCGQCQKIGKDHLAVIPCFSLKIYKIPTTYSGNMICGFRKNGTTGPDEWWLSSGTWYVKCISENHRGLE